ncbi:hypothetical protein EIP86_003360 [Pleurotus ostreatoroseus]|nr:hypothetical protein EIP86_003360 [Pleurotus ostreatoroseus]
MSGTHSTLGGTQSPPLQDPEPLGVSNMRGDKPQGVPDAKQREQYFSGTQSDSNVATEVQPHLPTSSADKMKKQ